MMKLLTVSRDIDGSEIITSEPFRSRSEEMEKLAECYKSNVKRMADANEHRRFEWHGYIEAYEQSGRVVYEPAHFLLTNKKLLISQVSDRKTISSQVSLSDCLGYGTRNADCFVLPEIIIRFDWDEVSFLCPRDSAQSIEQKLFGELRKICYSSSAI